MVAHKTLSLAIPDMPTLRSAYMPIFERGGVFVPTNSFYTMGQHVCLLLALPGESEYVSVTGEVAWISPPEVSGDRMPGIGVHFSQQDTGLRERIETLLTDQSLEPDSPSFTL